jgi:hypothetical protein
MGIFSSVQRYTYEKIGSSPLYVLFQSDKGWAEMHRKNFEKYVVYRGLKADDFLFQRLKLAIRIDQNMTYKDFVDMYMESN